MSILKRLFLTTTLIFIICKPCGANVSEPASPEIPESKFERFEQKLGSSLQAFPKTFAQNSPENSPQNLTGRFKDEYGRSHFLTSYLGEVPVILVFTYFRCPNLCTLVLNGLVQALQKIPETLGKDYKILTISIDPHEKPPLAFSKKLTYLARLGMVEHKLAKPNTPEYVSAPWHFLTGEEPQINDLATAVGFNYRQDPISKEYSHPSGIVIVTPQGTISKYLFGIQFDAQDLHNALLKAQLNQQSSWSEEILLYCFHYDPKLSPNGPLIMKGIRITGAVSALSLILYIFHLFSLGNGLREKQHE
ncbi:MAG: SCO family protein [Bdellovibrionia bacterium]